MTVADTIILALSEPVEITPGERVSQYVDRIECQAEMSFGLAAAASVQLFFLMAYVRDLSDELGAANNQLGIIDSP